MIVYVLGIIFTTFFAYVYETYFRKTNKIFSYFIFILTILPLSIIAGVRDYSVGTDVTSYVLPNFQFAQQFNSFFSFNDSIYGLKGGFGWFVGVTGAVRPTEFGYNLLTFFFSKFTNTPHLLMFMIQFITLYFVMLSIKEFKKIYNISVPLSMFIYSSVLFLTGLNEMRQFMAASILLYALILFIKGKYIKYTFFQYLAFSIHVTSLMGILFVFIFLLINMKRNRKIPHKYPFFLGITLILLIAMFGKISLHIIKISLSVLPFLANHLGSFDDTGGFPFQRIIVFLIPGLTFTLLYFFLPTKKSFDFKKTNILIWFNTIILSGMALNTLYVTQISIPRLGDYARFIVILAIPLLIDQMTKTKKVQSILLVIILGISVIGYTAYSGQNEVFPYTSDILNITK